MKNLKSWLLLTFTVVLSAAAFWFGQSSPIRAKEAEDHITCHIEEYQAGASCGGWFASAKLYGAADFCTKVVVRDSTDQIVYFYYKCQPATGTYFKQVLWKNTQFQPEAGEDYTWKVILSYGSSWVKEVGSFGQCNPNSVDLERFEIVNPYQPVEIEWETVTEIDNLGFNLYRRMSEEEPWTKLNEKLIPSKVPPGSPVGATYEWLDKDVEVGETYYYRLEDLDVYGKPTYHGPISVLVLGEVGEE